jgi:hypothetical protein
MDAELACVVLMAELDGLFARHPHIGGVPGAFEGHNEPNRAARQQ